MTKERKLGKNLFFSALASGSNLFLFALSILAARCLGDAAYGKFSYALDYVTMFTYLAGGSICLMGTINVARDRAKVSSFFGNLLSLQTLLTIGTVAVILASIRLIQPDPETRLAVYILTVAMVGRSYKSSLRMVFKAFERFDLESLTMALGQGALLAVGVVMLWLGYGLVPFALAFAIVRMVDLGVTIAVIRRTIAPLSPRLDFDLWPALMRGGLLFAAMAVLNDMAFRVDTVFLGFWTPYAQIGWYKAAYKIPEGLAEIPVIVAWTLLPTLSIAHTVAREEVVALYRRGAKLLLLAALPLAAFFALRADDVVQHVFGPAYSGAAPALRVLMLGVPFMFVSWISSSVLMSIDKVGVTFWRSTCALAVNVLLNLVLIPRLGIMGAAVSTVATEVAASVLVTTYLFRHGYHFPWAGTVARITTAAAAMVVVTLLLQHGSLLLAFPLAMGAYLVALHLVGAWDVEERQIFLGVLGAFDRRKVAGSEA